MAHKSFDNKSRSKYTSSTSKSYYHYGDSTSYNASSYQQNGPSESTRLLLDSVRLAHEADRTGENTLGELLLQGENLECTAARLQDMKEMVEAARVTVKRIQSKTMRKKLMLWLVIAVMFIIDVYMIYRMARNGGSLIGSSSSSSGSSSSSLSSSTFVGSSYLSDWMIPFDFLHSSHNLRGI